MQEVLENAMAYQRGNGDSHIAVRDPSPSCRLRELSISDL